MASWSSALLSRKVGDGARLPLFTALSRGFEKERDLVGVLLSVPSKGGGAGAATMLVVVSMFASRACRTNGVRSCHRYQRLWVEVEVLSDVSHDICRSYFVANLRVECTRKGIGCVMCLNLHAAPDNVGGMRYRMSSWTLDLAAQSCPTESLRHQDALRQPMSVGWMDGCPYRLPYQLKSSMEA